MYVLQLVYIYISILYNYKYLHTYRKLKWLTITLICCVYVCTYANNPKNKRNRILLQSIAGARLSYSFYHGENEC